MCLHGDARVAWGCGRFVSDPQYPYPLITTVGEGPGGPELSVILKQGKHGEELMIALR